MPIDTKDRPCLRPDEPLLAEECSLPAMKEDADAAPKTGTSRDTAKAAAEQVRSVQATSGVTLAHLLLPK